MSFPQDGLVTIFNGSRLERARIVEIDSDVPEVGRAAWNGGSDVIYLQDEGWDWARGHGEDVEAALLLTRSVR